MKPDIFFLGFLCFLLSILIISGVLFSLEMFSVNFSLLSLIIIFSLKISFISGFSDILSINISALIILMYGLVSSISFNRFEYEIILQFSDNPLFTNVSLLISDTT